MRPGEPPFETELADRGHLRFDPAFLDAAASERALERLSASLPWRQDQVTVFGRRVRQPRLVSWHGDPGCVYRYSGLSLDPQPWTPELESLRARVAAAASTPFNTVLVNLYRDGADSMGWHADDEPCFGTDPVIASLSLGGPRRFLLRHRRTGETRELLLTPGSLLTMSGTTQRFWKHSIPKTARPAPPRINLTFRHFLL